MRNKTLVVIIFALLILTLTACQGKPTGEAPVGNPDNTFQPITVTDGMGRSVVIEKEPLRIVSLAPANTEMLFALGLGDKIVGVTEWCNYPQEALAIEKVGDFQDVNIEKLIAVEPHLILATTMHEVAVKEMEKVGIPSLVIDPSSIQQILDTMLMISEISGIKDDGEVVVKSLQARIDAITSKTKGLAEDKKPMVFYEVWNEPLMSAGPGSFINDLIILAGGINLAGDAQTPYPMISIEILLDRNPEIIFHSYMGGIGTGSDMFDREGWKDIKAIKDNKIYELDADTINRPGPRIIDALEKIAKSIHPELFK